MELIQAMRRLTPRKFQPFLNWGLRSGKKTFRTLKRHARKASTKNELIRDFHNLGLSEGDTVLAHSSLSGLGPVQGGAPTVIEAIIEVIGSSGTLAMPAFPMIRSTMEYLGGVTLFDPVTTPSRMGKITETFRSWPGVRRSIHPSHSVCAIGLNAAELLKDHYLSLTPFGPSTPFYRLCEQGAFILGLGLGFDIGHFTVLHVYEDLTEDLPLPIYEEKPVEVGVLVDGVERKVQTKVHNPVLTLYRLDNDTEVRSIVLDRLLQYGYIRFGKTGCGSTAIIKAKDLLEGQKRMFREGITIYNTPRMAREGWKLSDRLIRSYH